MMPKSRLLGAVGIVAVVGGVLAAQTQASPAFEVASVKPSGAPVPIAAGTTGWLPGGRYLVRQTNLLNLLGIAYRPSGPGSLGIDHIDASHVSSWVSSSRFDIDARAPSAPVGWGGDEVDQPYLRALLRERFKLQVHFEKRDMPVYWMSVAKGDGALGPNMKRTTAYDCDEVARLRRENPSALAPPNPARPLCGVMMTPTAFIGGSVSAAVLAQALRGTVGALIVDRTGLTGYFDIDVHYTPEARAAAPTNPADAVPIPEWPTLITAIQDQLGLKLERQHEPQDILVIDHVEPPTPD